MKRFALIGLLAMLGLSITVATPSYTWAHGGWGGGGGWGAGWFVGGLALGTAIGVSARPYYYYPAPVYAYPAPAYAYPAPGYAYPPPAYATQPPAPYATQPPPPYAAPSTAATSQKGEWVTVPGQEVSGRWVPEHKAWVPANQ